MTNRIESGDDGVDHAALERKAMTGSEIVGTVAVLAAVMAFAVWAGLNIKL